MSLMLPDARGQGRDPRDFTDRFNTELSAEEELRYRQWVARQSKATGRDMSRDAYDYDMRGFWKGEGGPDMGAGQHFPDTYKKPNHPTFSNQSKYSPADGLAGGVWSTIEGKDYFSPGMANLKHWSAGELRDYFDKYGDGAVLDWPASW